MYQCNFVSKKLLPTLHVLHLWLGEDVVEDDNLGLMTDGLLSGQN